MFTRILVPTDFSEPSDAALAYARVLADKFGASLHVLHVFESPFVAGPVSPEVFTDDSPAVQAMLFEEAKNRLQHRVTATDRMEYAATTEIVGGHSARTIADYATERKMDLIVMGTHGRSGVAHLLMGSVAEKVVRTAPCPVMTVRRAAEGAAGSGQWTVDSGQWPTPASTKASTGRRGGPSGPPSSCPLPTAGYGFTSPNFSMR